MLEAVITALGIIGTLVSYFVWKAKKSKTVKDILEKIEHEREIRAKLGDDLKTISLRDYLLSRDLKLLLKKNKRDPK